MVSDQPSIEQYGLLVEREISVQAIPSLRDGDAQHHLVAPGGGFARLIPC
jgi:hypothetical protein